MKKLLVSVIALLSIVGLAQAKQATTKYELALINAAKEGNAAQVRGLLEAGTDPNVTDKDGNTPLMFAANRGDLASVDMLLYAGADVNAKGGHGLTPLMAGLSAVGKDGGAVTFRILKEKPDVNAIYRSNANTYWTTLFIAVDQDNFKVVEALIKQGADVNQYVGKNTPLLKALSKGQDPDATITEILLKAGADPYLGGLVVNQKYKPLLQVAKESGNKRKIELMKEAEKTHKAQHDKDVKLLKAAKKGKVEQVKQLLAEGANPNAHADFLVEGIAAKTPLMLTENLEVAQILLDNGADIDAVNIHGWTALMWAFEPKQLDKFKWLIKHGTNVNHSNAKWTPLTLVLESDYSWERFKALLDAGADVNLHNLQGRGPLFYAKLNEHEEATKELLKRGAKLTPEENEELIDAIAQKHANKASASGLGSTVMQGLVDTGVAVMQYSLTK